jgi:hypothetical protein
VAAGKGDEAVVSCGYLTSLRVGLGSILSRPELPEIISGNPNTLLNMYVLGVFGFGIYRFKIENFGFEIRDLCPE